MPTLPTAARAGNGHERRRIGAAWSPLAPAAGCALLALGAAAALRRVEVVGDSMRPTLVPGDRLLALRVPRWWALRPSALVACSDPRPGEHGRLMVKRVAAVTPAGVEVRGDRPSASTDSRQFGPLPRRAVRALVLYRYAPPARAGILPRRAGAAGPRS